MVTLLLQIPWKKEVECTGKEGEPDTSKLKPSHKAKAAAAAAPKESESTVSDSASSDGKPTMTLADEPNYDSMPSVSVSNYERIFLTTRSGVRNILKPQSEIKIVL